MEPVKSSSSLDDFLARAKSPASRCIDELSDSNRDGVGKISTTHAKTTNLKPAVEYFEGIERSADADAWESRSKRPVATISVAEIRSFTKQLRNSKTGEPLAQDSVTGILKNLKTVFGKAVTARLIESNPCKSLVPGFRRSKKMEYVELRRFYEFANQLDLELQVMPGLAMFAGMRAPSEEHYL